MTPYFSCCRQWLPLLMIFVALCSACTTRRLAVSQPAATEVVAGAQNSSAARAAVSTAAISKAAVSTKVPPQQADTDEEVWVSAGPLSQEGGAGKKAKVRRKLAQLQEQLNRMQTEQTLNAPERNSKKLSLPAKMLVSKLTKKAEKLRQKQTAGVNELQATNADGGNLVLVGVLLAVIGLLLALLSSGGGVTIGVVLLIVGLVMALVGLL